MSDDMLFAAPAKEKSMISRKVERKLQSIFREDKHGSLEDSRICARIVHKALERSANLT